VAVAIAFNVVVDVTVIGAVYFVDPVEGVDPSVV
jgi:hypothetical protein